MFRLDGRFRFPFAPGFSANLREQQAEPRGVLSFRDSPFLPGLEPFLRRLMIRQPSNACRTAAQSPETRFPAFRPGATGRDVREETPDHHDRRMSKMSIYEELGVVPVVNAIGNRTLLGGNTPAAAVRAAMDESEEYYAFLDELSERVGEQIAGLLGIEAAMVTSGAAAALVLGAAACMAGDDDEKIEQLPDTGGMPHQFIIQKHLRLKYERCMTIPGGVLVEVGDEDGTRPEHVEDAIGPDTAAIHTLAQVAPRPGTLPVEELVRIGRARGIPVIVDAAGSVYPTGLLSRFVKMGCDLVAYGAKYYGSVNTSGLLTGRRNLVKAAFKQSFVGFEASP